MRTLGTFLLPLVLLLVPACANKPALPGGGKSGKKASVPTNLPIVVVSPQFILETDIGPEFAPAGLVKPGSMKDPARKIARMLLERLDTQYRTLYGEGFGLASDKVRKRLVLESTGKSVFISRQEIETVRSHPVRQMRVALFTDEKDYREYVAKARLLEYYGDAALNPQSLRLATYLHGTEDDTLDALFRLVCHGFVMQLAPDFPPWLEFGMAAYLTRLDRRRGMYLITGKDPERMRRLANLLRGDGKINLRELLTDRAKKTEFTEEKKLRAYGFVCWMQRGKSRRNALYSYVHELRFNEDKRQALAMWQAMPKKMRGKRPDPEPESAIQARFFHKLHDDLDQAGEYCTRFILSKQLKGTEKQENKETRE